MIAAWNLIAKLKINAALRGLLCAGLRTLPISHVRSDPPFCLPARMIFGSFGALTGHASELKRPSDAQILGVSYLWRPTSTPSFDRHCSQYMFSARHNRGKSNFGSNATRSNCSYCCQCLELWRASRGEAARNFEELSKIPYDLGAVSRDFPRKSASHKRQKPIT